MGTRKLICAWLVLITLAVYWPVTHFEFTNYDDLTYVTENPIVRAGLTTQGLAWAFETVLTKKGVASNYETVFASDYWHPVTWISHMVDCQVYGLKAGGHHFTNVCFHLANTILLLLLLHLYTGDLGRSAFVAALFAWHPLHVEPVAWIAARKDLLSTFFWLLAMLSYGKYAVEFKVRGSKFKVYYVLALGSFALGLMSKPMVVTLPFLLLLLDYWPLKRWAGLDVAESGVADAPVAMLRLPWQKLIWEKIPFFALSAVIAVITLGGRKHAGVVIDSQILPYSVRFATVPVNYVLYLWKAIWPFDLAVLYPYAERSLAAALASGLFLAATTAWALHQAKKRPYLIVGWLWFLGTLVPVIGISQVGIQSIADRYTYVPLIGIFILAVWGGAEFFNRWPKIAPLREAFGFALLVSLLAITWWQVHYWQNSVTLFTHTVAVTSNNIRAEYDLADGYREQGNQTETRRHLRNVLTMHPNILEAHFNCQPKAHFGLGTLYGQNGDYPAAEAELRIALKEMPRHAQVRQNLGNVLLAEGRFGDAANAFESAADLEPVNPALWQAAGFALFSGGQFEAAATNYAKAVELEPNDPMTHDLLGEALAAIGNIKDATRHYNEALRVQPRYALTHLHLGILLADQGMDAEATAHFNEALTENPQLPEELEQNGSLLVKRGQTREAISNYKTTLRLNANNIGALEQLAWLLATQPNSSLRDGQEALRLALRACELTENKDVTALAALDAAYAETGNFSEAIATAQRGQNLAIAQGEISQGKAAEERISAYGLGKSWRQESYH